MDQKKRAFTTAAIGLGGVALAMVLFYYFQNKVRKPEGSEDSLAEKVEAVQEVRSDFAGTYAATDGAMEGGGKRITSFLVVVSEGLLQGSARVDTVGGSDSANVPCNDVRVEGKEFFMKCQDAENGIISLNGAWSKDENGGIGVSGKVMWTKNADLLLDTVRQFQLLKN
jgi:hypothetical protein